MIRRVAEGQTPDGKSSELPVFDPTTATAKIFGKVILEGKPEIPKVRQPAKPASLDLRLPPGKYELVAWHEKFGEQVSSFEAAANSPREVNFTFSVAPKQ